MRSIFFASFMVVLTFQACDRGKELPEGETLLFGHRGSGSGVYNDSLIENTKESVIYAFQHLDGAEIDIQMSADGTVWLYHDDHLGHLCSDRENTPPCIPAASDSLLETLKQCRGSATSRLYKLEDIFELFHRPEFAQKKLSLDVKGYFQEDCFPGRNAPESYFRDMAAEINRLITHYGVIENTIFETNYTLFFNELKTMNPEVSCHFLAYDDLDGAVKRALDDQYAGVSFNLRAGSADFEKVKAARHSGLQIQLWTVYSQDDLEKAKALKPYSIQISTLPIEELK